MAESDVPSAAVVRRQRRRRRRRRPRPARRRCPQPHAEPDAATACSQESRTPQVKKKSIQELHIDELLDAMMELQGASDLHIASASRPIIRADGDLEPLAYENMTPLDVQQMMYGILTDEQIQKFESTWELDFSYALRQEAPASASTSSRTKAASPPPCV